MTTKRLLEISSNMITLRIFPDLFQLDQKNSEIKIKQNLEDIKDFEEFKNCKIYVVGQLQDFLKNTLR